MTLALACTSEGAKRELLGQWRARYTPAHVRELVACARRKDIARHIAAWIKEGNSK